MIKRELVQGSKAAYAKFILYDDKLIIERKSFQNSSIIEYRLEEISFNRQFLRGNTSKDKKIFLVTFIGGILYLTVYFFTHLFPMLFLSIGILLLSIVPYFAKTQDAIFLMGGKQNIGFRRTDPNEQEVIAFIDEIEETTRVYVKEKYSVFSKYMTEQDVMGRLMFLKNKELLSEEECDDLYQDYKASKLLL